MDPEKALLELNRSREFVLKLRDLSHESSSINGGLVTAGDMVEEVLRSVTNAMSMLTGDAIADSDSQDLDVGTRIRSTVPVTDVPEQTRSSGGKRDRIRVRNDTGGRRIGLSPGNHTRILTSNPFNDGYIWNKYGQKNINGSNHKRNYFRCTRRSDQGCPATKQVQQTDDSSSKFVVTYIGRHTCQNLIHGSSFLLETDYPREPFSITFASTNSNNGTKEEAPASSSTSLMNQEERR